MSPLRKRMVLSQSPKWTVTVWGPSGGHERPNSVVSGLQAVAAMVLLVMVGRLVVTRRRK